MQRDARERLRPIISMMRVPRAMLSFVWRGGEKEHNVRHCYSGLEIDNYIFDHMETVA